MLLILPNKSNFIKFCLPIQYIVCLYLRELSKCVRMDREYRWRRYWIHEKMTFVLYRHHRKRKVKQRPPTLSHSRFSHALHGNPNILLRQQFHGG